MGKLFYFICTGGVSYSANADLNALQLRNMDEEMKPVLYDLIERLLCADSVSGPDSTLAFFHPFSLRSHQAARTEWLRWATKASRNQELEAHLTEENLMVWSESTGFKETWSEEKEMIIN